MPVSFFIHFSLWVCFISHILKWVCRKLCLNWRLGSFFFGGDFMNWVGFDFTKFNLLDDVNNWGSL